MLQTPRLPRAGACMFRRWSALCHGPALVRPGSSVNPQDGRFARVRMDRSNPSMEPRTGKQRGFVRLKNDTGGHSLFGATERAMNAATDWPCLVDDARVQHIPPGCVATCGSTVVSNSATRVGCVASQFIPLLHPSGDLS